MLSRQTQAFKSPALRQVTLDVHRVGGINLGQGVCNLPVPEYVMDQVGVAVRGGVNRYSNPRGLLSLREALSKRLRHFNKIEADPEREILITCGATGAFEGVCGTLLDPGDEVIVFEPTYPYHMTALSRYQANVKLIELKAPNWEIDFDQVRAALSPRTKFILINTPGNPTGKVFTADEFRQFAELGVMLVTDEIYEYMTFDGLQHISPASMPELKNRVITMGGYSKTFSITGWRIGYAVVPAEISESMTSFLDAVYVCPPSPLQEAVAAGINHFGDEFYEDMRAKYETKRDYFAAALAKIGMDPVVPAGAYYMIASFANHFPQMDTVEFSKHLIETTGVGSVPSSDFVRDYKRAQWVRFCLANEDDVLSHAVDRLTQL